MVQLMSNFQLNENPIYFAYRRTSELEGNFIHLHQGIEFLYIHEGSGTIVIEQETYNITPETLFIFQPYKVHKINISHGITGEKPFIRSILLFEPKAFKSYLEGFPTLQLFFNEICNKELKTKKFHIKQQEIDNLFNYHQNLQFKEKNKLPIEEHALFISSYLRCIKNEVNIKNDESVHRIRQRHRAEEIMEWIDQNFTKKCQLEDISRDLHLSPYYISHSFKEATGCTVTEYLNAKRIQHACLLLVTSDRSISQISDEIGIMTTSYFCQLFKKLMGISPNKYRLHVKKGT